MPTVQLTDRALIDVAGPEAEHFLQNLITTDLDRLAPGEVRPAALLSPQGKILFDFLVSRHGPDAFLLECRADIADDLVRRLTLYKLRAKVTISKRDQALVSVSWEDDSGRSQIDSTASRDDSGALIDIRFATAARVWRHHGPFSPSAGLEAWDALRVQHAAAESGADYALGDAFPHDVLLDQNGGVGFAKGCYVGQEVVSRMQHRGTARRRVLIAEADVSLPAAGTEVLVAGRTAGALGTVAGRQALAILRIDRVKDAVDAGEPITAGGVPIRLAIPAWATFTFPSAPGESASGTEGA